MRYYKYKDKKSLFEELDPYFNLQVFSDEDLYEILGVLCINQDTYKLKFQNGFFKILGVEEYDSSSFDLTDFINEISENIVDVNCNFKKIKRIFRDIKSSKSNIAFINNVFYSNDDLIKCLEVYFINKTIDSEPCLIIVVKNNNLMIEDKLNLMELNNQKNILLKEIYHRVKNNLQILNSLINIQQRFEIPEHDIINSMKLYIFSIAIAHEQLYSNENFDYILLTSFFKKLKNNLLPLYHSTDIDFIFDIEDELYLNLNSIIPFSLVLNKLILNSIKYSYPDDFEGNKEVFCSIKSEGDLCKVQYRDYGVGLYDNADVNLIKLIIDSCICQIDGDFSIIDSDDGLECYIEFLI